MIFGWQKSESQPLPFADFRVPLADELFADDKRLLSIDDAPVLEDVQHFRETLLGQLEGREPAISSNDILDAGLFLERERSVIGCFAFAGEEGAEFQADGPGLPGNEIFLEKRLACLDKESRLRIEAEALDVTVVQPVFPPHDVGCNVNDAVHDSSSSGRSQFCGHAWAIRQSFSFSLQGQFLQFRSRQSLRMETSVWTNSFDDITATISLLFLMILLYSKGETGRENEVAKGKTKSRHDACSMNFQFHLI